MWVVDVVARRYRVILRERRHELGLEGEERAEQRVVPEAAGTSHEEGLRNLVA